MFNETHDRDVWRWYYTLCAIAAANMVLLIIRILSIDPKDRYAKIMKFLGIPWVFECIWRSIFPSLYLQRFVWWDTVLNSIILDRSLACVGELCWVSQFTSAMVFLDRQIHSRRGGGGGHSSIRLLAFASFTTYVAAECVSYYNVATTNEYYAALEVVLDGIAFVILLPGYLYLWALCPGSMLQSRTKIFLGATAITCVVYPAYNFFIDAPMYMARYHEDERNHKSYFPFWEGLKDASVRRIQTHAYDDWYQDMTWMVLYFSLGAWSGLLLMDGPRLGHFISPAPSKGIRLEKAPFLTEKA